MKIRRDECGVLHIEAEGIEVIVQNEDTIPRAICTVSPSATRATMKEVDAALGDMKRWPTRPLPRI